MLQKSSLKNVFGLQKWDKKYRNRGYNGVRMVAKKSSYRTRAIITRGMYTFYPIFEGQKRFFKELFCKILTLYTVSIQEWLQIKSGL